MLATPLHHAAEDGFSDVVLSLLEAKANVNCQDQVCVVISELDKC